MIYAQVHLTLPAWVHDLDTRADFESDAAKVAFAIRLSERNITSGTGGPFGAAIFDHQHRVIGVGVNRVVPANSSVAHAEMMAFMTAQQRLSRFRLNSDGKPYVLATSAQPCCMCYGATVWAGIDQLLIGASASDVEELTAFDEGPLPEDWVGALEKRGIAVTQNVLREQAREVLRNYQQGGGAKY